MKKVIAVSTLAMAGMFSAQTLADENKTGFYVTGKAGVSVMSLSEQRFVDGEGAWADKYKGSDKSDTVFGAGLAVGYDFYQHYNVPVRTEVEFYGRGNAESKYRLSYWESAGGAEFDDAQNKLSVNTLMLNAYYDFRNSSAFTPWISAGLGYARVHHKTSYIYTDNSPAGSEVYSASASKYENNLALMNPLMILVKIIKLRWIHILSYDQMVSRKINNQTTRCANSIFYTTLFTNSAPNYT